MKSLSALLVASIITLLTTGLAFSETHRNISGTILNGTPGFVLEGDQVSVKLNVLEGIVSIEERFTTIEQDGTFSFEQVDLEPARVYVISAQYNEVTYSESLSIGELQSPIIITVYETNESSNILTFESYNVIVTGTDPQNRLIEILERVSIKNESGTTFSPKFQEDSGMMPDLLRFALPIGAKNLDVRSNLIGGQILEVDRGFAVDTPIPPTTDEPHYLEFIYRIEYEGPKIDISRNMRFGAEYFRFVVPLSSGIGTSSHLNDLGSAVIGNREFQLLEAEGIEDGFVLDLFIDNLPQPTVIHQITRLLNGAYIKYALPSIFVFVLLLAIYRTRKNGFNNRHHEHELKLLREKLNESKLRKNLPGGS